MMAARAHDAPLQEQDRHAHAAETCDLCSDQWVFVLATGRSGSTSIWEALNSLPGVSLAGENQGSLEVSYMLLGRYTEARARESVALDASAASVPDDPSDLLCALQHLYRTLVGIEARGARGDAKLPARKVALGFKELLSLSPQSTWFDHDDRLPPARHLSFSSPPVPLTTLSRSRSLALYVDTLPVCAY